MPSRYAQVALPAVALALLICVAAAAPATVVGQRLYSIEYRWLNQEFTLLDSTQSDTLWVTQSADTYRVRMAFYRLDLPTSPADCRGWGVQSWTANLGPDGETGVLMQVFPGSSGDTVAFSYPAPFWGQWGTYHACPGGQLLPHRSPEASDGHNAWLLNAEAPATEFIIVGVRTYPGQVHLLDRVELLWDSGTDAAEATPDIAESFSLAPCYPNPFNSSVTVPLVTQTWARVRVDVYNVLGQVVATPLDGPVPPGLQQIRWTPQSLGSGTYVIVASQGTRSASRKILYLR